MSTEPSAALSSFAAPRDPSAALRDPGTIVALATPPGHGALALVRLAGPDAFRIATALAPSFDPSRARLAQLVVLADAAGELLDRALVTAVPAPASFSGDDTVEFSSHGGTLVPARLVAACLAAGARLALPGEFSRRAVINGKLDLLQAEGMADLIAATAPAQARQALAQLDGALSARITGLRAAVLACQALLAYAIDFPEEDDGPVSSDRIMADLTELQVKLCKVAATSVEGERVRRGALVVLAGPPNAGKSSLFNALLGRDRALVSDMPGTTRDAVEAETTIDGWPVTLVDTAGLRSDAEAVEAMGIAVSHGYLERADIVLYCAETLKNGQITEPSFTHDSRFMVVRTKIDLSRDDQSLGSLGASALTGAGLGELRTALVGRLFTDTTSNPGEALLTRVRHLVAAEAGLTAVGDALGEAARGEAVLAAQALTRAADALADLIGVVDREDVFDRVFAGFCVGK